MSKPLLLALLIAVAAGLLFALRQFYLQARDENDIPGLAKKPANLTPVTDAERARVVSPVGGARE